MGNYQQRKVRNRRYVSVIGLLLMHILLLFFSYYTVCYIVTVTNPNIATQTYLGKCVSLSTYSLSIADDREMVCFHLDNGDTIDMTSTLLWDASFDSAVFHSEIEKGSEIFFRYSKYHSTLHGLFTGNYELISICIGDEEVVPSTIRLSEISGLAWLFGIFSGILAIPVAFTWLVWFVNIKDKCLQRRLRKQKRKDS